MFLRELCFKRGSLLWNLKKVRLASCKCGGNVTNSEAEELNKQKPTFAGHSKAIPRVYI